MMTEKDKRIAIITGTVILAVLLLLLFRRGARGTAGSDGAYPLPAVTGPSLGPIYGDGPRTFVIPGLDLSGRDLNMIGSCCSDCMQSQPSFKPQTNGPTYVFNQGNAGANIYNYVTGTVTPNNVWPQWGAYA